MSRSETETPFLVESPADVQVTIYDAVGAKLHRGDGMVGAELPCGLYRVQLERAGRVETRLVDHSAVTRLRVSGPALDTPAPLAGAAASHDYYTEAATRLSAIDTCPPLGPAPHLARLFVFVRRESRDRGPPVLPSEPVTLHDAAGRPLVRLGHGTARADDKLGCLAYSGLVAPGTYRLRAAHGRRDVAITIPAGRAAHVFIADDGAVRLDDLRIALRPAGARFDPVSPVACAMESVIAALRAPDRGLPAAARALLPSAIGDDLCFGVASAHLLWRSRDLPALRTVMAFLVDQASELPDVAILGHVVRRATGQATPPRVLSAPPLMRASLIGAMTLGESAGIAIDPAGAIRPATCTGLHDSIWCTWSDRAWDARWIHATVDALRARDRAPGAAAIAQSIAVPIDVVRRTIEALDAAAPSPGGRSVLDLLSDADAPLAPVQACKLVQQALEGLARLHRTGTVHGGVQPGNLLVRDGAGVALVDRKAANASGQRARPHGTLDPAHFMPREQLLEARRASPASDVWSIAATLYFLLTLDLPRAVYADQTEREAALHNPIVPIGERTPDLPPLLVRCLDRALSDDPAQRPADAAAFRDELTAAVPESAEKTAIAAAGASGTDTVHSTPWFTMGRDTWKCSPFVLVAQAAGQLTMRAGPPPRRAPAPAYRSMQGDDEDNTRTWLLEDREAGVSVALTAGLAGRAGALLAITARLESQAPVKDATLEILDHRSVGPTGDHRMVTSGPLSMFGDKPAYLKSGSWLIRIKAHVDRLRVWEIPIEGIEESRT